MGLFTTLGVLATVCMFIAKFFALGTPYEYSWLIVPVPFVVGFVLDVLTTIVVAVLFSAGAGRAHRKFFRDF